MIPTTESDTSTAFRDSPPAATARRDALIILLVAMILGSALRFYRLGVEEMNRGEAAAWTAAVAPDLPSVFAASKVLDPGKSGIYDIVLHFWIALVGDQVGPMRSLSAFFGTLSIFLLFAAVREILRSLDEDADESFAILAAAFAALLYATNLRMITTDRIARMYPLMIVAIFAQLRCFARLHRRRSAPTLVSAAVLTDLAVACNFTAMFFFAAEALLLAYLWFAIKVRRQATGLSVWWPMGGLLLAGALFLPIGLRDASIAINTLHAGILGAIEPQPPWWPLHALQVLMGNAAFWTAIALTIIGVWVARGRQPLAIRFILCWLLLPFAMIEMVSYVITPLMVERYVLASLVAFLVLAAVGLATLPNASIRYAIAILIVAQSLAHVRHHWRAPEDAQWREAARFALGTVPEGQKIAVIPPEPVMVVRYYLPETARDRAVAADAPADPQLRVKILRCGAEPLLIASTELPRGSLPSIAACYPRVLRRFRLVDVRGR
jgi:mannosyltransferase